MRVKIMGESVYTEMFQLAWNVRFCSRMIGFFSGLSIATDFGSIMNDLHLAQRYDDVTQLFLSDQYPWPSNKFCFGHFPKSRQFLLVPVPSLY